MPKFIIEREMPAVGESTPEEIKGACGKSNDTIAGMDNRVQWQHSYVTNDKLYCVYIAPDEEAVREHADKSGFPASSIQEVSRIIDPVSAEESAYV